MSASGVNPNANSTSPTVALVGAVASQFDHVLWFTGRVIDFTVILIIVGIIGALIVFRREIGEITGLSDCNWKDVTRPRNLKGCLKFLCCCGCPCLGDAAYEFQKLDQANEVLVVTLLAADEIPKKMSFWVQAVPEPVEGVAKASRFHRDVRGPSHDLGEEIMELDWYGDEDDVVISVHEDTKEPFATVHIPREKVEKYAAEAEKSKDDLSKGARSFSLVSPKSQKPSEPTAVQKKMIQQFYQAMNIPEPDTRQLEHLKQENEKLKTQMRTSGLTNGHDDHDDLEANKCTMRIILRFEIRSRNGHSGLSLNTFKASSFNIETHHHDSGEDD